MPEKHNNSNDPQETQPTLNDGTFTFKDGGEPKKKFHHDWSDIPKYGSGSLVDVYNIIGFINEKANSNNGIGMTEYDFHKAMIAAGVPDDKLNDFYESFKQNKGFVDEYEEPLNFVDPAEEMEPPAGEDFKDDAFDDDLLDYDEDDDDLLDYGEGDDDQGFDEPAFAKTEDEYSKIFSEHEEEIKQAEKEMGDEKQGLYKSYKEIYDLDANLVNKASPEEFAELRQAINTLTNKEKNKPQFNDSFKSELANVRTVLYPLIPEVNGPIKTFPQYKDKLEKKKNFLQNEIDTYKNFHQEAPMEKRAQLVALEKLESLYDRYLTKKKTESDYEESIADAMEVIGKFQDTNSLYSVARHEKAKIASNHEEAMKMYGKEAQEQQNKMTYAEKEAIESYSGQTYQLINYPIHGKKYETGGSKSVMVQSAMNKIKNLTSALDKCALKQDATFICRVGPHMDFGIMKGNDILGSHKKENLKKLIGMEFKDDSVMSCTASKDAMQSWNAIDMIMYCPKGTKANFIAGISQHTYETEVLINRGYHLVVRDAYVDENTGKPTLKVDLILGSDKDRLSDAQLKALYEKNIV